MTQIPSRKFLVKRLWRALAALFAGMLLLGLVRAEPEPITVLDLTALNQLDLSNPEHAARAWDSLHAAASIQGIVNRKGPRIFIVLDEKVDRFWLSELTSPGNWLAGSTLRQCSSVGELLDLFSSELSGVVTYDARIPATSNLASTIAGVENRLAIRVDPSPNSLYQELAVRPSFPADRVDLVPADGVPIFVSQGVIAGTPLPSTGSTKNDAYLWAISRYLESGKCSPKFLANYIDTFWVAHPIPASPELFGGAPLSNSAVLNHDFFISQRAFFCDLLPWHDEKPVDDPGQWTGNDRTTLLKILRTMSQLAKGSMFTVGGSIPWAWKYASPSGAFAGSGGKHTPVQTDWEWARISSAYNGVIDSDPCSFSGLANASFYQHFPLQETYPQAIPALDPASLQARGLLDAALQVVPKRYAMWCVGDYQSSAWLNRFIGEYYADPARGKIPLNWAINPNLSIRVPQAMHYSRTKASPKDFFVSSFNGGGYLTPGMLAAPRLDSSIPDGWDAWIAWNKPFFNKFDLKIVGGILEGFAPALNLRQISRYAEFSPQGVGWSSPDRRWGADGNKYPFCAAKDIGSIGTTVAEAATTLMGILRELPASKTGFVVLRTVLNSPSWHSDVQGISLAQAEFSDVVLLDAATFFELIRLTVHPLPPPPPPTPAPAATPAPAPAATPAPAPAATPAPVPAATPAPAPAATPAPAPAATPAPAPAATPAPAPAATPAPAPAATPAPAPAATPAPAPAATPAPAPAATPAPAPAATPAPAPAATPAPVPAATPAPAPAATPAPAPAATP